jgi:putative peptidoglycan lipid II flippase
MARSSVMVMGAFVAAKVVGLLRDRAIAHQFGDSAELDAYFTAFTIPDLLFTVLAGGALISAFLPVFAQVRSREDEAATWRVASGVANLVFLATLLSSIGAALLAPQLIALVAPGLEASQQALAAQLMRIVLISTVIFSISGLQMGILNAFHHFLTPALAPVVYNLGVLLGALFLAPRFGIMGVAYGVVLGALGHLLIKLPALFRRGYRWVPVLGLGLAEVRRVFWLLWPRMLSLLTVHVVNVVNNNLASALAVGAFSTFRYGWNISQMPQSILGTAVATVAFPTLADQAARGQRGALRDTAVQALRVMVVLTVPATVGLWMLSGPVVEMLLLTGAFDAEAAEATSWVLRMFALGLLGHVTLEIVARMYYAQQDTLTPLAFAVAAMVLNVGLALLLVGPMLQAGLALANSLAVSLEVLLALWVLRGRLDGIGGRSLADALVRSGVASAVMAMAIAVVMAPVPADLALGPYSGPFVQGLVRVALGTTVGLVVYLPAAWLIGLPEVRGLAQLFRRRLQ